MNEADPNSWYEWIRSVLPYITTIILSAWGGAVKNFQSVRDGSVKFSWATLAIDLSVASFAGILTYFLCEWAGITGALSALLISISGHMGAKSLHMFAALYEKILNKVAS